MANQKKKLQQAAIKFRRENPSLHNIYCVLLSVMARCITRTGIPEVTIRYKNGEYYEAANN